MQTPKTTTKAALATAALLALAAPALATPSVALTLTASGGTYQVYATDSAGDNAGLADYGLTITGSNGLSIISSTVQAPRSSYTDSNNGPVTDGFNTLRSNGVAGAGLTASQSLVYAGANDPSQDQLVFQGVGQVPHTGGRDVPDSDGLTTDHDTASWSYPVLIASGKYGGAAGTLTADVTPGSFFQVLNGSGPGAWTGPGNVSNADVTPGSVTLNTPEPTPMTLAAAGAAGMLLRRKRKV